jgi:hypothetical protein
MVFGYTVNRPLPATAEWSFPSFKEQLGQLASQYVYYGGPHHNQQLSIMHKFSQLEGSVPIGEACRLCHRCIVCARSCVCVCVHVCERVTACLRL